MIETLFPFAALLALLFITLAERWIDDRGKYWYVFAMYCCLSVAIFSFFKADFGTVAILIMNGVLLGLLLRACVMFAFTLYDTWQLSIEFEQLQQQYVALTKLREGFQWQK